VTRRCCEGWLKAVVASSARQSISQGRPVTGTLPPLLACTPAVVSFSGSPNVSVSVYSINPLLAAPPASSRRRHLQQAAAAPTPASASGFEGVCNVGGQDNGAVTYDCTGASGQFAVITGTYADVPLSLSDVSVYLTTPPSGPLSPPPGPVSERFPAC
jgi:hypothetical protein